MSMSKFEKILIKVLIGLAVGLGIPFAAGIVPDRQRKNFSRHAEGSRFRTIKSNLGGG